MIEMADTAIALPMSPIGLTTSLSQSVYERTDTFWRVNRAMFTDKAAPGDPDPIVPTVVPNYGDALLAGTYKEHFYDNIFLIPQGIDFGAVVAETTRTFFIWNAYLRPVTLEDIQVIGDQGLTLTNPTPPTSTYLPLQFTLFTLTADPNGPAAIDATYDFVFDVRTMRLKVGGIRSELWSLLPSWDGGYRVSYEFKTEIITSRSGSEQRRALRITPRKSVEFSVTATNDKAWRLRATMDAWQDKGFVMPELTRSVTCLSTMQAGDRLVLVDSVPDWLKVGAYAVLRSGDRHGMRIVESIDGTEVTFTSGGSDVWPEGTLIHPGLPGRVETEQATTNLTSQVTQFSFKYNVTPTSEQNLNDGTPFASYNGRELFMRKPNWANSPSVTFRGDMEVIDYGRGKADFYSMYDFRHRVVQATFLSRNRAEATEIERFFRRMKGRQRTFYMPTWQPDIVPKSQIVSGSRFINVQGVDLARLYEGSQVFKHIIVILADGTSIIRPVAALTVSGEDTIVDVGTEWSHSIPLSEITMISWLLPCRFASDILTIEWLSDEVAQYRVSMQTRPDIET